MTAYKTAATTENGQLRQVTRESLFGLFRILLKDLIVLHQTNDSCDNSVSLINQFFAVLDHMFVDGISTSTLFSYRRGPFEAVSACLSTDSTYVDTISTINELGNLKNSLGKLRAWIRLCIMRRILSECMTVILESEQLRRFYGPSALLLSEDAAVLPGLLVVCATFSWNFDLKTEDLSYPLERLDFSSYLRNSVLEEPDSADNKASSCMSQSRLREQCMFQEEMNRTLSLKLKSLELALEQSQSATSSTGTSQGSQYQVDTCKSPNRSSTTATISSQATAADSGYQSFDRSLENSAAETDTTRTDVADDISSDPAYLTLMESVKSVSTEMESRLDDLTTSSLIQGELIHRLGKANAALEYELLSREKRLNILKGSLAEQKELNEHLELRLKSVQQETDDLKNSLYRLQNLHQETLERYNTFKQAENSDTYTVEAHGQAVAKLEDLELKNYQLKEENEGQVRTISELALKLERCTVECEQLREQAARINEVTFRWIPDDAVVKCMSCSRSFNLAKRKHHCRRCGGIFCLDCSSNKTSLPSSAKLQRVCDHCYANYPSSASAPDEQPQ